MFGFGTLPVLGFGWVDPIGGRGHVCLLVSEVFLTCIGIWGDYLTWALLSLRGTHLGPERRHEIAKRRPARYPDITGNTALGRERS